VGLAKRVAAADERDGLAVIHAPACVWWVSCTQPTVRARAGCRRTTTTRLCMPLRPGPRCPRAKTPNSHLLKGAADLGHRVLGHGVAPHALGVLCCVHRCSWPQWRQRRA
jgi:hypothetical protein